MERQLRDGFVTAEVPRVRKDGTPLSLWLTASCVRNADGTIRNYVRVFTDISLLKETQQKLEQLASFDTLTGLPNRRLLHDRLEQTTRRTQRINNSIAVMFIDLDDFKKVNDTYGHAVGDQLLWEVGSRLQKCIRSSDSVGRLGGDEFGIVLEGARLPAEAAQIGERIVAAMAEPVVVEGHRLTVAASIPASPSTPTMEPTRPRYSGTLTRQCTPPSRQGGTGSGSFPGARASYPPSVDPAAAPRADPPSRPTPELARSRKVCRGFPSIGAPCDTRMRLSDSISAHCCSWARRAFGSLIIAIFTTLGICASLPAKPAMFNSQPLKPSRLADVADQVVQHERRAVRRVDDERRLARSRSGNRDELDVRVIEVGRHRVDRHHLLDLCPSAFGGDDLHRRVAVFPRPRVQPVLVAWHDQERGTAVRFEGSHFLLGERDRAEDDQPRGAEADHGHASRQMHHRHADIAGHRQNVDVDLRELAVRQDLPLSKRPRHRRAP